jgi:hypothetical protein
MADHNQLASFIQRRVGIGRVQPGTDYRFIAHQLPYFGTPLPTPEQLGEALYRDAEFRGLQLGGLLNTPAGEFLEYAVELVVPRMLIPEFDLIVSALKYASARQQGESRGKAALVVGGSLLFGLVIKEIGKAA